MIKHYTLDQAVYDFGQSNLAQAAEVVLTDKISYQSGRLNKAERQKRFPILGQEAMGEGKNFEMIYADELTLSGDRAYYQTAICLDQEHGELVCCSCSCNSFEDNYFACKHIYTLLMAYLMDTEERGADVLQGSAVLEELRRITGLEDPFIPGILRKTSQSLRSFQQYGQFPKRRSARPIWETNPMQLPTLEQTDKDGKKSGKKSEKKGQKKRGQRAEAISVECILSPVDGKVRVELKAGPGRCYVIRSQEEFLRAFRENRPYTFGKKDPVPVGRNHVRAEDLPILDYFLELYDSYARAENDSDILPYSSSSERRWFCLTGRELDAFMEVMDGRKTKVQDYRDIYEVEIRLDQEPQKIQMKKETYGASLSLQDETAIGCGLKGMYLRQGDCVMRLPLQQWERRNELIKAGQAEKELYIRDKDLPAICQALQSMDQGLDMVEFHGMLPETYLPQLPQIRIYLDYPQEGLVACEVKASYKDAEQAYNLFDRKKDVAGRNLQAEQEAGERLWPYFNAFDSTTGQMYLECEEAELYLFLTETIPLLSEVGQVFVSDQMNHLKVRPIGEVNVGLQIDAGSLLMSLKSNMMDRSEMIEVLSSYSRKKHFTRLKNGSFITFSEKDAALWEMLAETYKNYGKKNPEAMKLPLFRALYLDEMLEDRDSVTLSETKEYADLLEGMGDQSGWSYVVPASLDPIMRPYQKDGFRWICMLKEHGFGGILADDMGLGKTLQVLAFLLSEQEAGKAGRELRTLIITPASLVYNWKKEIETFTPTLSCQFIAGNVSERQEIIRGIRGESLTDIYITSYDLLKRDILEYEGITFANEIIDEAQFIKNQNTQAAKGVRLVQSDFRMALTGTPIENRLSELWSIFDYLMPGFLYKYSRFRTEYETPVIQNHDQEVMDRLRKMVHPFILRRLKKDVLKDLPDKLEETVSVELEGEQRRVYDAYAERLRLFLENQNKEEFQQGKLEILAELTKLRQICCGPEVFLEGYQGENAKKEACIELIRQAIDGGHKVLLFSQFTSVLDGLCQRLRSEEIRYHRIDGSTGKEDRMEMVEAFDQDDVPVFCISLKAGGTGLNLTAADIVIHYDPWWNIAAQNQATDRTHRIGQENTVVVYQLIAEDTIEQRIVQLQQIKAQLAEDILSGEGISSILIDKEELLGLL